MIKYLDLKRINDLHDGELRESVNRVFDSGWYLKGEATRQFETHYAEYIGTKHCVGCGNGLDALTLILRAYIEMGVMTVGDEIKFACIDGPEFDGYKVNFDEAMGRMRLYKTQEGEALLALEEGNTHHGGCGNCGGDK